MRHATVSSLLLTGMLLMTVTIAVKRKVNGAETPKGTVIFHSRIRSAKRSSIPERNEFNAHENDTNGSSKRDADAGNNWNILHENFRNEEDPKGNQEMPVNGEYGPCICAINIFAIGGQADFEGGIGGGNQCPIYCFPMPGMGIDPSGGIDRFEGIDGGGGFDGIMGIDPGVGIGAPQFQFEPMNQPQQFPVDRPYPVPVPYVMNRYIPISVPKPVPVPVPRPFAVHVQVPHPIMVPVEVPRPYPIGGPGIGIGPGGGIDRMPSMPMPVSDTCLPMCDNPSDGFPVPIPMPPFTICLPFCNNASNSDQMPMSRLMPIPAITICLPICENITESQNNSARRMQSSKEEDLERVQMADTASGDAERVLKNIKVAEKHAKKKVTVGKKSKRGEETENFKNSEHGKDYQFVNHFRAVVGNSKRSLQDQKGLYDYDSEASIGNSQNYLEYVH